MPWQSAKQARWGHTPAGMEALGGPGAVAEWDRATPLPWRETEQEPMAGKNWIQKAVKHPGALTRAAQEHGLSKSEEAERESHSSDPHIRGRGLLAKRFMKGDLRK
jgi:hypothetical protein